MIIEYDFSRSLFYILSSFSMIKKSYFLQHLSTNINNYVFFTRKCAKKSNNSELISLTLINEITRDKWK